MATYIGTLSYHIQDAYGIRGETTMTVEVPDTATLADIASDVATGASDLNPLTAGQIVESTLRFAFPGVSGTPAGDIEKGGLFNFSNAATPYATGTFVPDIHSTVLNSSGLIDLSNTSVQTWISWMTTAHAAITVVTKGLQALNGLLDALIAFRKHRKPLTRKTKEL